VTATATSTEKAAWFAEALPWLAGLRHSTLVVKYGGRVLVDAGLRSGVANDLVFLRMVGVRVVVVHGGGPQITHMLDRLGIESAFTAGLRVTSPAAMDVVRMVLVGQVGRDLVGDLNQHGSWGVGLSGEDGGLFTARRTGVTVAGVEHDLGLVGDIEHVRTAVIHDLVSAGRIPVVASVAPDASGQIHNVNADVAASALAAALGAARLILLTDVPGLCRDHPANDDLVSRIDTDRLEALLPSLAGGIAPKMRACLDAVRAGVGGASIIDGRVPHALLLELLSDDGIGTMVTPT
jgi:acetylglutamate kinase